MEVNALCLQFSMHSPETNMVSTSYIQLFLEKGAVSEPAAARKLFNSCCRSYVTSIIMGGIMGFRGSEPWLGVLASIVHYSLFPAVNEREAFVVLYTARFRCPGIKRHGVLFWVSRVS